MIKQPPVHPNYPDDLDDLDDLDAASIDRPALLRALESCLGGHQNGTQDSTQDSKKLTVLALIDLKQFSQVNQRIGYLGGDQVLGELQQRLASIPKHPLGCRRTDGDKFALIISPLLNAQLIPLVAKKIIDATTNPFYVGTQSLTLEAHIGFATIAESNQPASDAEKLLQSAEAAAKQAQHLRLTYFVGEASASNKARHKIAVKKRALDALSENSFELFYQPQIGLLDGRTHGAEGLIRWNERDHGVNPEQLVAIIEESGRMDDFFAWTIQTAIRESANWRGQNITTAINLSASCLHSPQLFRTIESSLNLWGAEPSDLCIEVTESTIQQDLDQGFQALKKIKELGVRIAIDDFGTGYSSLEYFKFIPADELKIDKSFISNMRNNPIDMDIVKLILDWGKRFQMETIAEGVEDAETMALLTELGCTYAQGYHIGKAMPAEQFSRWLESH
jgi:diguanylate cyclase (GGDEF)-like protein